MKKGLLLAIASLVVFLSSTVANATVIYTISGGDRYCRNVSQEQFLTDMKNGAESVGVDTLTFIHQKGGKVFKKWIIDDVSGDIVKNDFDKKKGARKPRKETVVFSLFEGNCGEWKLADLKAENEKLRKQNKQLRKRLRKRCGKRSVKKYKKRKKRGKKKRRKQIIPSFPSGGGGIHSNSAPGGSLG